MLHSPRTSAHRKTQHPAVLPTTSCNTPSIHPTASSTLPILPEPANSLPILELNPPQKSSSSPISYLVCTQSYIASASTTSLSVWRLNPAYPCAPSPSQTSPFCHLQSQWLCPHDFQITALALSPDESALALSLQHQDPDYAANNVAIALLHPYTCLLLTRVAFPNSLQFAPLSSVAPSLSRSLCFVPCSPSDQHRKPFQSVFDTNDLPPHLHDVFHQYGGSQPLPAKLKPSPHLVGPLAPFALAVSGTGGVAILYRFLSTYQQVYDFSRIDSSNFFRAETTMAVSSVAHLDLTHYAPNDHEFNDCARIVRADRITHFLGLCSNHGVVLMYDGVPVLKIPADRFHPLALCAARRDSNRVSHAVVLASHRSENRPDDFALKHPLLRKRSRSAHCERHCFVMWTPGKSCEFVSIENGDEEIRDISILEESVNAVAVMIFCTGGFVAKYRVSLLNDNSFQVSPCTLSDELRCIVEQNELGRSCMLLRSGGHIVVATALDKSILVKAVPYR